VSSDLEIAGEKRNRSCHTFWQITQFPDIDKPSLAFVHMIMLIHSFRCLHLAIGRGTLHDVEIR